MGNTLQTGGRGGGKVERDIGASKGFCVVLSRKEEQNGY